eukprot:TRINITY_DN66796_c8_g11_i1.p2 TRINITY_DN66796_c8_g11~~TRINITY_DN66796_c8_g11_i1.p2  ORF type:complete len:155 (+),score=83.78 TRINITY_DN66796_c8_g11_i1:46-465(+)
MSKSDVSDLSRINLTDDSDTIAKKIRKAKMDNIAGISFDREQRPEVSNLVNIMASVMDKTTDQVVAEHASSTNAQFKQALTDVLVPSLAPIRQRIEQLQADPGYVDSVLAQGAERARSVAARNMADVRALVGLHAINSN